VLGGAAAIAAGIGLVPQGRQSFPILREENRGRASAMAPQGLYRSQVVPEMVFRPFNKAERDSRAQRRACGPGGEQPGSWRIGPGFGRPKTVGCCCSTAPKKVLRSKIVQKTRGCAE